MTSEKSNKANYHKQSATERCTDGPTNGWTNKAAYRVVCTRLKKPTEQGTGYLGGIFCYFRALRRAPRVTYGWCIILEKWQCKTNQKNLTGDRYQVTVCLFTIIYNNSEVLQLPPLKLTLFHHNFFMNQARKLWLVPFSCKLFAVPICLSFYYMMTIFREDASFKSK